MDAMVHGPFSDTAQYRFGRLRIEVGVGQAVFLVPGQHYELQTPPGTLCALGFALDSLEREIKPYLRSADSVWFPRTCRLSLAGAVATTWWRRRCTRGGGTSSASRSSGSSTRCVLPSQYGEASQAHVVHAAHVLRAGLE